VPVLFPFGAIGIPPEEREFTWLVTVFCIGVLLILFGLSAWIGGRRSVGLRDVIEAGGVQQALNRVGAKDEDRPYTQNAAAWCVVTGALLLLIYFVLFAALG